MPRVRVSSHLDLVHIRFIHKQLHTKFRVLFTADVDKSAV